MDKKVYSIDGKEGKTISLNDDVFSREISYGSIYYVIKNELANRRVGTASVKGRSEVAGSKQKPYRQKGTGRARAGRKRSPLWKGGGVTFGPQQRDYSYTVPKKIKRLAMKSILSLKAQDDDVFKVVENFTIESGKTKELVKILKNFIGDERTVIVLSEDDKMIRRAGRNLPNVSLLSYNRLSAHELFYGKKIILFAGAAEKLNDFYKN